MLGPHQVDAPVCVAEGCVVKLEDATVLTALVPAASGEPILFLNDAAALRMTLVSRESVVLLTNDWQVPGVYVLLFGAAFDETEGRLHKRMVYVGKAGTGGLRGIRGAGAQASHRTSPRRTRAALRQPPDCRRNPKGTRCLRVSDLENHACHPTPTSREDHTRHQRRQPLKVESG